MAKGLTAATVHEVSGGEVMKGFVVYFAVRIFLKVYIYNLYINYTIP